MLPAIHLYVHTVGVGVHPEPDPGAGALLQRAGLREHHGHASGQQSVQHLQRPDTRVRAPLRHDRPPRHQEIRV